MVGGGLFWEFGWCLLWIFVGFYGLVCFGVYLVFDCRSDCVLGFSVGVDLVC